MWGVDFGSDLSALEEALLDVEHESHRHLKHHFAPLLLQAESEYVCV